MDYKNLYARIKKPLLFTIGAAACLLIWLLIKWIISLALSNQELTMRSWVSGAEWGITMVLAVIVISMVLWLIYVIVKMPTDKKWIRVIKHLLWAVSSAAMLLSLIMFFIFSLLFNTITTKEEKLIDVNGTKAVAVIDTTGLKNTGISYHEYVNVFTYKTRAFHTEEQFDHNKWENF